MSVFFYSFNPPWSQMFIGQPLIRVNKGHGYLIEARITKLGTYAQFLRGRSLIIPRGGC